MSCLPKPKLRGLHMASTRKHLTLAILTSITGGVLWKIFVCDARKQKYRDYYLDYDPEVSVEWMSKWLTSGKKAQQNGN